MSLLIAATHQVSGPIGVIIFIVAAIAIIGGIIFAIKQGRKRAEILRAWAEERGWHFVPKSQGKDSTFDERFPQFSCLREGRNRYAYNVARGETGGRDLWAFHYHYETTSTDSKGNRQTHHHTLSAVVVHSGMALKPLLIRREGMWDKVTSAFGFDDIDFESAEFSRAFFVKSPDRKWAYDVINQANMEFLMEAPKLTLELAGPHIIAWKGARFAPPQFDGALALIEGFLSRIPKDIRKAQALGNAAEGSEE